MPDNGFFMDQAIGLAEQGRGHTAPNPCVGAVLVRGNEIVARGWHRACGQPHAEVEALRDAAAKGVNPRDCRLFVTLEPCNHHGKTPPCTQAILEAGIPEVVIGCPDQNPVASGGAAFLQSQGVRVHVGVREAACADLVADFRLWQTTDRPWSILKLATTLDGKIATRNGHSAWISGPASRREVHVLRSWCGAVIVGGSTFRADNPALTCRLDEYNGPQPLAVIVTTKLPENPQAFALLSARPEQTIFWTSEAESHSATARRLTDLGVSIWPLPTLEQRHGIAQKNAPPPVGGPGGSAPWPPEAFLHLHLLHGLRRLRQERGCWHVLTEGGGRLAGTLLEQGLADEVRIFQAMKVLGDEQGRSAFAGRDVGSMAECWNFDLKEQRFFDADLYLRLQPKE